MEFTSADGTRIRGWWCAPSDWKQEDGALLHCNGNAGNLSYWGPVAHGWTRDVKATGSGEEAQIQSATWSGGSVPTGEDAVFHFVAEPSSAGDATFTVKQTYASGKVVEWSGAESSDTPAPIVHILDSVGGGGGSNTLAIIALVVGALGLLVGLAALFGRKRAVA